VRFITAHGHGAIETTDWRSLCDQRETLAIYMGVATLTRLQAELLRHGRAPKTPVAFIENGSRPEQRVVLATLETATEVAARETILAPCLVIIGAVAALGAHLHWFGARPAFSDDPAVRGLARAGASL
jgi:uroporphyrin-III C-methyltransferase/precorrin-2 dehydrogenase/sirohydrochlorin ferrochelatase